MHLAICCYCLKRQTYCSEVLVWDMLKLFITLFSMVYFFVLRWTCFIYRHNRWLCYSIFLRLGTWGFTWHAAFYPDSAVGEKCPLSYLLYCIFLQFLIFPGSTVWAENQQSLCFATFVFHHDLTFLPVFSPMKYCSTLSGRTCNGSLACRKFSCAYCKYGTCPKQLNGVYEKVM